jgi:hypothetical protein
MKAVTGNRQYVAFAMKEVQEGVNAFANGCLTTSYIQIPLSGIRR